MRISDLGVRVFDGVARVHATIHFEDVDRAPFPFFADTEARCADMLRADPNALLVSALAPAWGAGEKRIAIEGAICPLLHRNLAVVFGKLATWYRGEFGPPPVIEPSEGFRMMRPGASRSVALLSCGVDSLATVRWNMLNVPHDHPRAIKAVAYVAHDKPPDEARARLEAATRARRAPVDAIAAEIGADVIPIRSNSWWLSGNGYFFDYKWHGAQFAGLTAFLAPAFDRVYIAAGAEPDVQPSWGSHPLLDNYYSSAHFTIEHDCLMTRYDKTVLISEWPNGMRNLRICQNNDTGAANCGQCEKCIRTSLTLLSIGRLAGAALPQNFSVETVWLLDQYEMITRLGKWFESYERLVPRLDERGCHDIARALREVLASTRRRLEKNVSSQDGGAAEEARALVHRDIA